MDSIEGTNCISNEKGRIDRIFSDSRDDMCREEIQRPTDKTEVSALYEREMSVRCD